MKKFKVKDKVILLDNTEYKHQQGTAKFGTIIKIYKFGAEDWCIIKWEEGHNLSTTDDTDNYPLKDIKLLKTTLKELLE